MDPIGLAGIAGLLFVKEAGLPIPVPGDLVVLSAGVAAANGSIDPIAGVVVIVAATICGGLVQFGLIRGPGRRLVLGVLARVGVSAERIDRAGERLGRRGAVGVAMARMTPGLRVIAIAAAALTAIPVVRFAAALGVGNAVFVGGHFALGFAVGRPALALVSSAGLAAVALVGLAGLGGVGWWLVGRWRARRQGIALEPVSAASWADAACPACLVLATIDVGRRALVPR